MNKTADLTPDFSPCEYCGKSSVSVIDSIAVCQAHTPKVKRATICGKGNDCCTSVIAKTNKELKVKI